MRAALSYVACSKIKKALLWFGAVGGLFRYDGASFTSFLPGSTSSLPSSVVSALVEDSQGSMWIGMDGGGLACLAPRSERFRLFGPGEGLPREGGALHILALCEDGEGRIIAGTGDGTLYRSLDDRSHFEPLGRMEGGKKAILSPPRRFPGPNMGGYRRRRTPPL